MAADAAGQSKGPAVAAASCGDEGAEVIDEAMRQQQQHQPYADVQQQQQQEEMASSTEHSYNLLASLKLLSSPSCAAEQLPAEGGNMDVPASIQQVTHEQQQQQQQPRSSDAEAVSAAEPSMLMQFNNLYQAEGDLAAAGTAIDSTQLAAGPTAVEMQLQQGLSSAGGASPGLAQVEKALLKLQTLRSTLQSLGSSAASSRQQSLRASRAVSLTGGTAVCSPEASSSQLPAGNNSGSGPVVQPDSAAAALPNLAESASLTAQPGREVDAAAVSTREWIKQLSQRIEQAGTGESSAATQLEAAMASLQAHQVDTAAAAAAAGHPEEAVALALAGTASTQGPHVVQSSAAVDAAAEAAAAVESQMKLPSQLTAGSCSSSGSSMASQRASTPLLQLLESGYSSEASDESACSPAVAAAEAAAEAAAGAVALAAACQEAAAAGVEVSPEPAELEAGRVGTPTGEGPSNPWLARLAITGPGSPNWSTATANSISTVEEANQPQDEGYAGSLDLGGSALSGAHQQSAWDPVPSAAMQAAKGSPAASHSAQLQPASSRLQPTQQLSGADAAAATAAAAGAAAAGGNVAVSGLGAVAATTASGRLQQMLDASDDTALLLSLALKLDTLAKKFKGQVSML
jgi:hypothetical protein